MRRSLLVLLVGCLVTAAPSYAASPGTLTWLSRVGLNGAGSDAGSSVTARPSADGSRVVFVTDATNLGGAAGTTGISKVYLRDVRTGALTLVSGPENQPNVVADGTAATPAISGDGRWIAFSSTATNLVP